MAVTVTLPDGATDKYMRFGDAYIKHGDGTLDVVRGGAKHAHRYAVGEWAEVDGDESRRRKRRFWS